MKLTDFLSDVGRPIAYYPSLRKITGSTTATILLCQFIYWRGKESDPNGWLYKTSDEIEEETGLSYNEQKTARANLVSAELIEEYYARLDHQMKFRVNLDMINLLWGTEQTVIPESDNPSFGKAIIHDSLNESENTAENTTLGDKSPDLSKMPMDWKLAHGQEITAEDVARMEDDKRKDVANLISIGFGISAKIAFNLAYAFQVARNITFPESKVKGQRKAIKEMLEMHVTPENVTEAVQQLTGKGMTVVDLFSVSKTAIDLANKPKEQYNPNEEHRL